MKLNYKKITQTITYLASKSEDFTIDFLKVIKLIYIADKYHLRKYGRLITGDKYVGMEYGPVPSKVKDILDHGIDAEQRLYSDEYFKRLKHNVISIKTPDLDELSETDIEAIDFAFNNYAQLHSYELAKKITHKSYEWSKHEKKLKNSKVFRMNIEDFFKDKDGPAALATQEYVEQSKIAYNEFKHLEKLYGLLNK